LLVHLLDGASLDPAEDFRVINRELAMHSDRLAAKPQVVALNKADLPDTTVMMGLLREELGEVSSEIHLISAVTGQGVRDLLRALADRLAELPREEPEEDIYVFRPHEQRESREFSITQEDEDHFRVSGQEIERLAQMTDWSSYEAMERFERIMIARGISEALELAGISLGDTVLIGELELEWR
jgi:GTP-binding protein